MSIIRFLRYVAGKPSAWGRWRTYFFPYQARAGQHGLLVVYDRSGPAICFVFLRFHFLLEAMMRKGKLIISTQCLNATFIIKGYWSQTRMKNLPNRGRSLCVSQCSLYFASYCFCILCFPGFNRWAGGFKISTHKLFQHLGPMLRGFHLSIVSI